MSYGEQLKDPRWQRKRLEALQNDNFACKICGDTKSQLHVHHGAYLSGRKVWDYDPWMLHTLCAKHHEEAEEYIYSMNEKIGSMKPTSENLELITQVALHIPFLSKEGRSAIESILGLTLNIAHLNHLLDNKS